MTEESISDRNSMYPPYLYHTTNTCEKSTTEDLTYWTNKLKVMAELHNVAKIDVWNI